MKKLFIVNSRAESKALARFKSAYFDYSAGNESDTRVVYTEFAGHAGEVASKAASEEDLLVIACGGGGIPVIQQGHVLKGASAVL